MMSGALQDDALTAWTNKRLYCGMWYAKHTKDLSKKLVLYQKNNTSFTVTRKLLNNFWLSCIFFSFSFFFLFLFDANTYFIQKQGERVINFNKFQQE